MKRPLHKRIVKFFLYSLALLIGLFILSYTALKTSLPQVEGTIQLKGISENVTIARDENGIPHISGENWHDVYFGIGFAHGQDRLWQLEMNRRIGSGRLAEIVGKPGLRTDRYFRTLGFRQKAEKAYSAMPQSEKDTLQAYADGINAFLKNRSGLLPPEFLILGVDPEPWTPVDTIVWGKMMWLSLSFNYRKELSRARLMTKLTAKQVAQLNPTYPGDSEIPLPDFRDLLKDLPLKQLTAYVGDEKPEGYGSNNWVISGALTGSGKPLLANDPHLGLTTPSIWYLVRLHNRTENKNVVGVSFPGSPSVVLGRNDHYAWGFTNTAPDTQDLFIEKLMDDPDYYQTPTGPQKFKTRNEIIKVKDAEDITLTVRESRHGPIMTDILDTKGQITPKGHVLALQWTALMDHDTQIVTMTGLMSSENFADLKEKISGYMGPQQNMIYADTKGNIGYFAPALVPIRHKDNKIQGRLPSPGWDSLYDWQGFIPVSELPNQYNVETGIIATANEKITQKDYPHFISRDWALPYRGNRIRDFLSSQTDHDLESMKKLQGDTVSDMARDLQPLLPIGLDHPYDAVVQAVRSWDGNMDKDMAEPLIFDHWQRHLTKLVLADELGEMFTSNIKRRPLFLKNVWSAATDISIKDAYYSLPTANDPSYAQWCDNINTADTIENCPDLSRQAFRLAVDELTSAYGENWQNWRWGQAHYLTQTHRPFGEVAALARFFQLSSEQSGGWFTVNVAGNSWRDMDLNSSSFGPSYRGLFDLNNLDNSLYVITTGQSGNPLSGHFDDMFPKWLKGDYVKIQTAAPIPTGTKVLTLSPH